jgi:FAD/FMN-containing dehydrogenase
MAFPFAPQNLSATAAAGVITLTIPATAAAYSYVTALTITGLGATAGSGVTATLSGLAAGNMSFVVAVPAGVLVGATPLVVPFPEPLQSTSQNVAIVLTVPSFGAGNTLAAATLHGYNEA